MPVLNTILHLKHYIKTLSIYFNGIQKDIRKQQNCSTQLCSLDYIKETREKLGLAKNRASLYLGGLITGLPLFGLQTFGGRITWWAYNQVGL